MGETKEYDYMIKPMKTKKTISTKTIYIIVCKNKLQLIFYVMCMYIY